MLFRKVVALHAILLLITTLASGQTPLEKEPTESADKLRTQAVVFLRETLADVNSMRSAENRISFTAELAALMWFHDEREARSMYVDLIGQFKDLIARYEARMNELGAPSDEDEDAAHASAPFAVDASDRSRLLRKFAIAMGVRQQIILSMVEHDADLAFNFYRDSLAMVANPTLRGQMESKDSTFETQLVAMIAEKDPLKAVKLGSKVLENGVNFQHIDLLRKLYERDPDRGREFGLEILSAVRNGKYEMFSLGSLIDFGGQTLEDSKKPNGRRAVYTEAELREMVEVIALAVLSQSPDEGMYATMHLQRIQKYLPARATQIRTRFKLGRVDTRPNGNVASVDGEDAGEEPAWEGAIVTSGPNSPAAVRRREEREKIEKQMFDDIESMSTKQLPNEERSKIVAQARKIIASTPGREKKITALSMLASHVAKLGDKELASEIMRDADRLVNPAPRNFHDFILSGMLASGYASVDPDKAFPILEETIDRANDVLAAAVRLGEFIDVNEDYISDGEVQVGAFGGQMVRGITKELNVIDQTIDLLAKADFGKTKNLANLFDRVEMRVLAKMTVLRAVLGSRQGKNVDAALEEGVK